MKFVLVVFKILYAVFGDQILVSCRESLLRGRKMERQLMEEARLFLHPMRGIIVRADKYHPTATGIFSFFTHVVR